MNSRKGQAFAEVVREVRGRFPEAFGVRDAFVSTGLEGLDAALGGGLCRGRFYEWVATVPSSGGTLLVGVLIAVARRTGSLLALVDAANAFDPECADGVGGPSEGFVWVRAEGPEKAVRGVDVLLRDPHFGIVVVDLRGFRRGELQRAVRPAQWYRLQRLAGARGAVLVLLTAVPVAQGVHRRLYLRQRFRLYDLERSREELIAQLAFGIAGETVEVRDVCSA